MTQYRLFSCISGSRQGDPLSAFFLFILSIEMLFVQVRENNNSEGLKIFGREFKLSAFADDTTYFVKHEEAAHELKTLFNDFAEFSSLRINSDKTECNVVDLIRDSTLILGCHYSYNQNTSD